MSPIDRSKADHRLAVCPYRHIKHAATRIGQDGKAYIGTEKIAVCGDADTLDRAREKCLRCETLFPSVNLHRPTRSFLQRVFNLARVEGRVL